MIYLTADTHFGHTNIIRHCNRPFASAEEMDAALIQNWNATVKSKDEIYILGDFTMRPAADAHKYLSKLNGRKYYIRGNHDRFLESFEPYEKDFVWIKDYHRLIYEGQRIILFHYPILEWDQLHRGSVHCYGHVHNNKVSAERMAVLNDNRAFNVGVDVNDYRPVSIKEILNHIETK